MLEPVPPRALLLFAQLLFSWEAAAVMPLEAGLLFCFPSTWKKNKTGLIKNTHGKCFIISSSSPTALWHCSVIRKDFSLLEAPSARGGRAGWWEPDTLSFPGRSFWRNLLLFPPGHIPMTPPLPPQLSVGHTPHIQVVLLAQCFEGVGGGWKLWTPNTSCCNLQKLRNGSKPLSGS